MKRVLCLVFVLLIPLYGCADGSGFRRNKKGNIVSDSGIEYAYFSNEWVLTYFGELEFAGSIKGEEKISEHLGLLYETGMFAIKDAVNDNVLIRYAPDNEWFSIYRKASLPSFDVSVDNCVRLEFVPGSGNKESDTIHATCGDGIVDASEIAKFLSDVRSQKDPDEAGLYELIKKPDGTLENCYLYGKIYGFFEEEPVLAVSMEVWSYNDLAYSISIDDNRYVLPTEWLQKLEDQ